MYQQTVNTQSLSFDIIWFVNKTSTKQTPVLTGLNQYVRRVLPVNTTAT